MIWRGGASPAGFRRRVWLRDHSQRFAGRYRWPDSGNAANALLAERFQMQNHRVTEEREEYALTVAKGGVKLEEARDGDPGAVDAGVVRQTPPATAAGLEGKIVNTLEGRGIGAI